MKRLLALLLAGVLLIESNMFVQAAGIENDIYPVRGVEQTIDRDVTEADAQVETELDGANTIGDIEELSDSDENIGEDGQQSDSVSQIVVTKEISGSEEHIGSNEVISVVEEQLRINGELLASFDFDEEPVDGIFNGGNAIAQTQGTYELQERDEENGKALYLDGTSNAWLNVTQTDGSSLLTGMKALMISFDAKVDSPYTSWTFYAAPNSEKQNYGDERYIGTFLRKGYLKTERYLHGRTQCLENISFGDEWAHVDVVYARNSTMIYINGSLTDSVEGEVDLREILGTESILQIGKANWGSGEYYTGWLDNIKIYEVILGEDKNDITQVDNSKITVQATDYATVFTQIAGADVEVEGIGSAVTDTEGKASLLNSLAEPSAMKRIIVTKEGYRDYIFYTTIVSSQMVSLFATNQLSVSLKRKKTGDDVNPYVSTVVYYQNELARTCGGQHFEKSDNITFRVCGVWNEKNPGYYCMYQEGGKSFESENGIFTLNIGDSFAGSGKIYAKMVAKDGTESEPEWVYITTPQGSSVSADDSYVPILNESSESDWQTDVPFLNNDKLSFDLGKLKTTIKKDGSKIRIMLGAETPPGNIFKDEEWEEWKKFCESQPTDLSLSQWKNVLTSDNMTTSWTVGAKIKATGYGWLENDMASDSTVPLAGGIQVVIDMSTSFKQQYAVGVIPVYMEESLGENGKFDGSVTFDTNSGKFGGSTKLTVTPSFSIGGGVGVLYVATVGAEGSAAMPIVIDFPKGLTQADLTGSLSLKASVLGFSYSKEMANGTYPLYRAEETKARSLYEEKVSSVYDMDAYDLPEEAVMDAKWYGDLPTGAGETFDSKTNLTEKLLQTGTSDLTEPMLVQEGDTTLAVFLEEDSSRNTIHRTKLVYTVYDEENGVWSSPAAVDDNGTGDFQPHLTASNGRIAVSWLDYSELVTDSSSMDEALQSSGICYAVWDENTGSFVKSEKELLSSPEGSYNDARICIDAQGNVTEAGVKNTAADIFGVSGDNYLFMTGNYGGADIDREFVFSQERPVSYDVAEWNGTVAAAVCVDTDGDLTTLEDREIYLCTSDGEMERLTNNDTYDSAPRFAKYQGSTALFWYTEKGYQVFEESGAQSTVLEEESTQISENFTVVNGNNHKTALVWSGTDENQVYQLTASLPDEESGEWSRQVVLTDSEEDIFRPSGYFNKNGDMEFLYRKGSTVGAGSLYSLQAELAPDLQIVDAYIEDGAERPGETTTVFVGVRNLGTEKITGYHIDVEGQTTEGQTELLPGESTVLEAEYIVPAEVQSREITIQAAVEGDSDTSNNTFKLTTGYADVSVVASEDEWENGKIVHVSVTNEEAIATDAVLEVHKNTADGELVSSRELGTLKQDDLVAVDFTYQRGKDGYDVDANALYYVVTSSAAEKYESNNYDYSVFQEKDSGDIDPETTPEPEPTKTVTPTPTSTPTPTVTSSPHKSHVNQTFAVNGLKYKVTKDSAAGREVRVTGMQKNTKTLKIPATVTNSAWKETFKVTSVKAKAFKGKNITKAVIGKNVTKIGSNAFLNCKKLKSVTIGKSVKTIGVKAFYGCRTLKKVTIKSTALKKVKKNAFKRISAKAVIKVPKSKKKVYTRYLKGKIAKGVKVK